MAYKTGKRGTMKLDGTELVPITNWKTKPTVATSAFHTNESGGSKNREAGVEDSTGSFDLKLKEGAFFPVERGQKVVLQLHIDETTQNYYEVPAIIKEWDLDCDINDGKEFTVPVTWEGNGPMIGHGTLAKAGSGGSSGDM